jgi:hypothetical protein
MTQARPAALTVTFIDEYCQLYQDVFPDVRSFDHLKQVQIGMRIAKSNARRCLRSPKPWARATRRPCTTLWPTPHGVSKSYGRGCAGYIGHLFRK